MKGVAEITAAFALVFMLGAGTMNGQNRMSEYNKINDEMAITSGYETDWKSSRLPMESVEETPVPEAVKPQAKPVENVDNNKSIVERQFRKECFKPEDE